MTFVMSQRAGEKRHAEDFFFLRPMMINIAASTKSEQLEELHTIHHNMYCFFFFFLNSGMKKTASTIYCRLRRKLSTSIQATLAGVQRRAEKMPNIEVKKIKKIKNRNSFLGVPA